MQAVTGVFSSLNDAQRAVESLRTTGVASNRIALLTPGKLENGMLSVPVDPSEGGGAGKAIFAVVGAAAGMSGGGLLVSAILPGVGPVTALGLLGVGVLTAAGAGIGAAAGGTLENAMIEGLPEDEIFVYEDALRQGRPVVIAMAQDASEAAHFRELLKIEGAETVDAARDKWWIGLRSAEREHYEGPGRNFTQDEKFYRLGFEAALHSRTRCKEFDQVSSEMESQLETMQQQFPGVDLTEPFTRGYQRGRDYYQRLCDERKAA